MNNVHTLRLSVANANVTVLKGSTDFSDIFRDEDRNHAQINHFHLGMYGQHTPFFEKVLDVIKTAPMKGEGFHADKGWYDNSDSQVDYFDTAYHISMNVGSWNKPYIQTA